MSKTLAEGALQFSQFSAGWQTYLYQNNPLLDSHKKLCDFTPEETEILKHGAKDKVQVEIRSNNTGRVDKVDYEGVIPRFYRLYLRRDITKLKQSLQDEIMSLVEKGACPTCGGTGLHPADAERIGKLLLDLRDKHNNVFIVEHSRQMIELADHIIELGEGAGTNGGRIVYQGDLSGLRSADTLTAQMMNRKIEVNTSPLTAEDGYLIENAHCHNLKNVAITIPRGVLTAVTGVAGSGKSSLVCHEFVKRYPQAIVIDQKPIGTSIRSTPATYTGVMDEIRKLFGKENGVAASWFSYNSKGGCAVCKGTGQVSYDMAFAEPVIVPCEECGGHRYNPTALSYKYKGLNIEDVMKLTIAEAMDFFDSKKIRSGLQSMIAVGLGYLTLGQPTSTLSGGEVERVKLASHLQSKGEIYVLDEPSTGLHGKDIERLFALLRKLVGNGNTVVIVEHRLELIAQADYIIDMGPEGGSDGGGVMFSGTPEELLKCERSKTAGYLRKQML